MSPFEDYVKDLTWLKLGNKALRAFPSSPRQKEYIAQRKKREAEIDASLRKTRRRNPRTGRFDRCVRKVTRSRSARNPYAVCAPTLKPRRRRNPRSRTLRRRNVTRRGPRGELFSLIARKGAAAPMVYTGDKFARHGKPVLFPTLATAKATARFMQRQYPTLRGYSIWAREV